MHQPWSDGSMLRTIEMDRPNGCGDSWTHPHAERHRVVDQADNRPTRVRGMATESPEIVPASGSNKCEVDYFTWDGHHFVQPAGAEVAVETLFDATRECVATGRHPTRSQWRPRTERRRCDEPPLAYDGDRT
ncbi:hypothetical protein FB384_002266 [Prauserella sediminis]|uniref:Uncharacterized protein n=1 Tax=Prauserella sediminis TaxID=577680 RepID=A0A839XHB6_9PSEU|nr:hypothetical protein [Prauserella sediminis]MBB3663362.1 hypothetical protein [Prauserella sediminis]